MLELHRERVGIEGAPEERGGHDLPAGPIIFHDVLHDIGEPNGGHVADRRETTQRRVIADEHRSSVVLLGYLLHGGDDFCGDRPGFFPVGVPVRCRSVFPQELVDAGGLLDVLRRREEVDEEGGVADDLGAVLGIVAVREDVLCRLLCPVLVRAVHPIEGDAGEMSIGTGSELLQTEGGVGVAALLTVPHEEQGGNAHCVLRTFFCFVFGGVGTIPFVTSTEENSINIQEYQAIYN